MRYTNVRFCGATEFVSSVEFILVQSCDVSEALMEIFKLNCVDQLETK